MKNGKEYIDPEILIGKYLTGEASQQEILWLEGWVLEKEENSLLFIQVRQAWNLAQLKNDNPVDVKDEWESFRKRVEAVPIVELDGRKRTLTVSRLVGIAALIIVLLGVSVWIFNRNAGSGYEYFETGTQVAVNQLADGSVVSLNKNASVRFENKDIRTAILKGDAYFEVKPDIRRPFVVNTHSLSIKVLGTAFYVNAKENRSTIEVLVNSGRVSVRSPQDSLILQAGQMASFDKNTLKLLQSSIKDVNYLSWKTKTLVFNDLYLNEVITKLNEVYDSQIRLDNQKLNNCKITVKFKDQSLRSILNIISETLDLEVETQDDLVILKGMGCE